MTTRSILILTLGLAALLLCGLASPALAAGKTITIKGSDTMVILGQRWAEEYIKTHPDVIVQITGGGSGVGIAALINGGTDVAETSRPMKPTERASVKEKRGKDVVETAVALDGLVLYVNQTNGLKEISLDQAKAVFTGKAQNWKDLGGADSPIIAYGRENNSGTYSYFKEHVLKDEDFAAEIQSMPGTAAVINAVVRDKNAIGYGGIAYSKGIKALKVKKDEKAAAVEPTMATVLSGKYPLSRSLYFYTAGKPDGTLKAFIEWTLGAEGQKICAEVGYYPIPSKKRR